ncbi:MAG: hypothetical protein ACYCTI_10030 [Acidimicrobiales bacterium]
MAILVRAAIYIATLISCRSGLVRVTHRFYSMALAATVVSWSCWCSVCSPGCRPSGPRPPVLVYLNVLRFIAALSGGGRR